LSDLASSDSHVDFAAFLPAATRYASLVAHRLAPLI
jgi:adenosylhomocysteine nucleosidase